MGNKFRDIDIKNCKYYFFDDMINIKNLDLNKIKIGEKSCKCILIYCIEYVTLKNKECVKINSANTLYLIINKINGYIKESNGNKYLMLFPTNENKDTLKKYEELSSKIRGIIRSIANNSDNYDEKYTKIKFNLDDDLPLNKTLELRNMIIVVRSFFHKGIKY